MKQQRFQHNFCNEKELFARPICIAARAKSVSQGRKCELLNMNRRMFGNQRPSAI